MFSISVPTMTILGGAAAGAAGQNPAQAISLDHKRYGGLLCATLQYVLPRDIHFGFLD